MQIDINDMFFKSEGQNLEYKEGWDNDDLASSIASMATSNGGYILIGVKNDGCPVGFKISSEDEIRKRIYDLSKSVTGGRPSVELEFKQHNNGAKIIIIRVHEGIAHQLSSSVCYRNK